MTTHKFKLDSMRQSGYDPVCMPCQLRLQIHCEPVHTANGHGKHMRQQVKAMFQDAGLATADGDTRLSVTSNQEYTVVCGHALT